MSRRGRSRWRWRRLSGWGEGLTCSQKCLNRAGAGEKPQAQNAGLSYRGAGRMFKWNIRGFVRLCAIGSVLAVLPFVAAGQWKAKDTEWASYAADLAGTRYRPLEQINAANFNELEIVWRIKTDNFGNRPEYKLEGTPLMVWGACCMRRRDRGARQSRWMRLRAS